MYRTRDLTLNNNETDCVKTILALIETHSSLPSTIHDIQISGEYITQLPTDLQLKNDQSNNRVKWIFISSQIGFVNYILNVSNQITLTDNKARIHSLGFENTNTLEEKYQDGFQLGIRNIPGDTENKLNQTNIVRDDETQCDSKLILALRITEIIDVNNPSLSLGISKVQPLLKGFKPYVAAASSVPSTLSSSSSSSSSSSTATTTGQPSTMTLPCGQILNVHHHEPHHVKTYSKDDEQFCYTVKLICIFLACIGLLCLCWVVNKRGENIDPRITTAQPLLSQAAAPPPAVSPTSESKDTKT